MKYGTDDCFCCHWHNDDQNNSISASLWTTLSPLPLLQNITYLLSSGFFYCSNSKVCIRIICIWCLANSLIPTWISLYICKNFLCIWPCWPTYILKIVVPSSENALLFKLWECVISQIQREAKNTIEPLINHVETVSTRSSLGYLIFKLGFLELVILLLVVSGPNCFIVKDYLW